MLLSDRDIRAEITAGRVAVEPFAESMVQPSSVDVRLDRFFRVFENHKYSVIDPSIEQSELTREVIVEPNEHFILHPGEFVLASTYEIITLPDDIAGRLEGKSSLGHIDKFAGEIADRKTQEVMLSAFRWCHGTPDKHRDQHQQQNTKQPPATQYGERFCPIHCQTPESDPTKQRNPWNQHSDKAEHQIQQSRQHIDQAAEQIKKSFHRFTMLGRITGQNSRPSGCCDTPLLRKSIDHQT